MSVKYILSQAGAKMGLSPSETSQRPILLRFLNEAAEELYAQSDMAGSVMEQMFKVNGDQTIGVPAYVGQIRALREFNTMIPWKITQLRARYNVSNWTDYWRTWRLKGKQALETSIDNQSVVVITTPVVESPAVTVTITGRTTLASSTTEDVVLSSTSVQSVNQWIEITALNKSRVNYYDITVKQIDDKVLAVIPNNEKFSSYQIIDVSTCPWLSQTGSKTDNYVEVLFKKKLPYLSEDGDEFPAQGYDNMVVNKMMQLWAEEEGKTDLALAYDQKATRSMARKHEEENRATQDVVALTANSHDSLLPRTRTRRPTRYGGYFNNGVLP